MAEEADKATGNNPMNEFPKNDDGEYPDTQGKMFWAESEPLMEWLNEFGEIKGSRQIRHL